MEDKTKGIIDEFVKSFNKGETSAFVKLLEFYKRNVTRIGRQENFRVNGVLKKGIIIYFKWSAEAEDPCEKFKKNILTREEGSSPNCCNRFKKLLNNNHYPVGEPKIHKCNCGKHLVRFSEKAWQKELEIYQILPAEFNLGNFYFLSANTLGARLARLDSARLAEVSAKRVSPEIKRKKTNSPKVEPEDTMGVSP